MLSYNLALLILSVLISPYIIAKLIVNKRLRDKFLFRLLPESIRSDDYVLVHLASMGEAKAFLNFKEHIEIKFNKKIIFSVTSNIGYNYLRSIGEHVFLSPVDFYFLYFKVFKYGMPKIAIFFETEIWPSYIFFLKRRNVNIFLINARMSHRSFNFYKFFRIFGNTITNFNRIIAKSEEDAKRFKYFNGNTVVCGNIKFLLKRKIFASTPNNFLKLLKFDDKKIFVYASVHEEEIGFINETIQDILLAGFRIVIAPRYLEDITLFENVLLAKQIKYTKQSKFTVSDCLLIDTYGSLEAIYSVSNFVFVCGSMNPKLKGHNPIEPLTYDNTVICGPYMDSFKNEVDYLKKIGCLHQINTIKDLHEIIQNNLTLNNCNTKTVSKKILSCYMQNLN